MDNLFKRIYKGKSSIIPILAAISNLLPFHIISESIMLLLWSALWTFIFYLIGVYPSFDIKFVKGKENIDSDVSINVADERENHEISIEIVPHKILKRQYSKDLVISFHPGISLTASSKKEQKYVANNIIKIPIDEIADEGHYNLTYALGMEENNSISGYEGPVKCECKNTIIKCNLVNKATIYWKK